MEAFHYRNGELYGEGVRLQELADEYGTPLFVYSHAHFTERLGSLRTAMAEVDPLICFSVKVNTNAAVIKLLGQRGAGADVVSGGELFRARRVGIPGERIVFAGVGKTAAEIDYGIQEGILFFTVESEDELKLISERARRLHTSVRVAVRVNPDVDPATHRFISTGKKENKFGLDVARAAEVCGRTREMEGVQLVGLHMHIGSQILSVEPYVAALQRIIPLCRRFREEHPAFEYLDIGGGLGISYRDEEKELDPEAFAAALVPFLQPLGLKIVMEPGRYIAGNAGVLLTRVLYIKKNAVKKFIVVDASMTELIRPALYEAYHEILPVRQTRERAPADVVGPVCESTDFLALEREMPVVASGDLLAVRSVGAYGWVMSSNYNSRPRAAEVMVSGGRHALIRRRETREDLVRGETIPEWL